MCTPTSNCIYYHDAARTVGKAAAILTLITAIAIGTIVAVNQGWPGGALPQMNALCVVGGAALVIFAVCCVIAYRGQNAAKIQEARERARNSIQIASQEMRTFGDENIDEDRAIIENPGTFIKEHILDPMEEVAILTPTTIVKSCSDHTKGDLDIAGAERAFMTAQAFFGHLFSDPKIFAVIALKYVAGGIKSPEMGVGRLVTAYNSGNLELYQHALSEQRAITRAYNTDPLHEAIGGRGTPADRVLAALPEALIAGFALPSEDLEETVAQMLVDIFFVPNTRQVKLALIENRNIGSLITKVRSLLESYRGMNDSLKRIEKRQKLMSELKNLVIACFGAAEIPETTIDGWNQRLVAQILPQCKDTVKVALNQCAVSIRLIVEMFDKTQSKQTLFPHVQSTADVAKAFDCIDHSSTFQKELLLLQAELNFSRPEDSRWLLVATRPQSAMARKHGEMMDAISSGRETVRLRSASVSAFETKHGVQIEALRVIYLNAQLIKVREMEEGALGKVGRFAARYASNGLISWVAPKLGSFFIAQLLDLLPPLDDTPGSVPDLPGIHVNRQLSERKFFEQEVFGKVLKHFAPVVVHGAMLDEEFNAVFEEIIGSVGLKLANALEELVANPDMRLLDVRNVLSTYLDSLAKSFDPNLLEE